MYTERLSENLALVATVDPQSAAAGTYDSDGVDMQKFRRAVALILTGAIAATGTFNAKLQGSVDNATFADITGKAITQLGDADDNKQAIIEITAEELIEANADYRYVRLRITTATAASLTAAVILAGECRYRPANRYDLASVAEIVA